jgi:hypothetical protein
VKSCASSQRSIDRRLAEIVRALQGVLVYVREFRPIVFV